MAMSELIVVTGAAGLIGGAVVRELNRLGHENLILTDHLGTSDKWMNLRTLRYSHYMEKGDFLKRLLTNPQTVEGDLRNARAFIHLGACSATTERDASYLIENNYEYSRLMAEFCAEHGIRMVYASSAATYGEGEKGYGDDESRLEELRPLNMYGYSKHMFDLWLKKRNFQPGFAGIKYFNIFGPNEYHKGDMRSLVVKAFHQVQSEGVIRLFKSYRDEYKHGEQQRDFLYVKDAARMTRYLALDNPKAVGVFNAGNGRAETWLALAGAIFEAMSLEPNIEFIEMPETLRDRYQYYTCAPMDKLRDAGFTEERTSLRDAVVDYVREYLLPGEVRA